MPGFGHIDLDLEDESGRGFEDGTDGEPGEDPVPPSSTTRAQVARSLEPGRRVTRKAIEAQPEMDEPAPVSVHEDRTRVVPASESLSSLTRRPPPMVDVEADAPGSQPGGGPSGSGIATRDDRVAAMRELYAKGDALGALMLGASVEEAPRISGVDHPDASIVVEFSLHDVDVDDPFGGLIPIDVDDVLNERERTIGVDVDAQSVHFLPTPVPPAPQPIAGLSLTMRQSIPRVLKSAAEVAKLPIDHRAGFLLSHFDGMQTLEEILDVCAMPTEEALDLISAMQQMGVIELD